MKILMACGGTGGHLFPGMAVAESFGEKVPAAEIVFVGTDRGLEKQVLAKTDWRLEMMRVPSLADKKGLKKIGAVFGVCRSLAQAHRLLKKEKPDLVIGTGGYAAGPVMMLASMRGIPTVAVEPNFVAGLTNRLLKPFVDRVVVANPALEKLFGKKTVVLGVPVRKSILKSYDSTTVRRYDRTTVFIFGGSQGAKTINDGMLSALPHLQDLKDKIHFIHQVGGQARVEDFEKAYREAGFSAEVYPFIENMGAFYEKASFVISRAGANTLAELVALKIPALLIPYPFSAAGHQEANAKMIERAGGAVVLNDRHASGEGLSGAVRKMVESPDRLNEMRANLDKLGNPDAADRVVDLCLQLVGGKS
ncbi:MAG: undecaprenyldiphospho-muramoylpentapeptide beta-N-acetylglucosaminyltransferase [Deltaproteobacteria bacterium]|nr:undecaprenyldiphospho-muramoylpentapeptide beta-N-acetylglucosaminyltransferase [Deltaproteobacteria bacterium]